MKTMHYRIRVVVLALVVSLFAVILWTIKSAWLSSGDYSVMPAETLSVSPPVEPDPWSSPAPDPGETVSSFPGETTAPAMEMSLPSPDPLFDTTGL